MRRPAELRGFAPARRSGALDDPRALLERLAARPRPRVLVVGDLVADRYIFGRTDRISREAPVLIVRHEREEVRLGGAGNVAWNLAALGVEVTAVGVLGRDQMGLAVEDLCRSHGIELRAIAHESLHTESKTRILAGGVNTSRQQMLRLDAGQVGPLDRLIRQRVARIVGELATSHGAILISDYGGGALGPEVIQTVTQAARQRVVTVDSRYNLLAFRGVTVAKPNEPELATATGLPIRNSLEVARAARALQKRLRCKAVLVTRGREGMLLTTGKGNARISPHGSTDAVDVTGAGDTVIATFTTGLAAGGSLVASAQLANVAGGLVVQKPGTAAVSWQELAKACEPIAHAAPNRRRT